MSEKPSGESMPEWAKQHLELEGKESGRLFNDIDLANPNVSEAIINDPTLTEQQKAHVLKTGSLQKPPEIMTKEKLERILKPTDHDVTTVEAIKQAKQIIGEEQLVEYFEKNKPKYFGKTTSDQVKLGGWAFESFARNIIKLKEVGYTGDDLLQAALDNIPEGMNLRAARLRGIRG